MKWFASWSRSAGSARWRCFMSPIASCVSVRRSTGSSTFVKSGALISMIRLPYVPVCSLVLTETGICATSGSSGSSECSTSQRRTTPAHIETTTSLTVQPCSFFTALTSSSVSWPNANRRCGETRPLNEVFGARRLPTLAAARPAMRPIVPAPGKVPNGVSSRFGTARGSDRIARSG